MKTALIILVLGISFGAQAAIIKGQFAQDLTAMLKKVNSADLVGKDIRCRKASNGIRITGYTCDLKVLTPREEEKSIRLTKSLAKQLWSEVPGDAVKVGMASVNVAGIMRCYRIDKCDRLDLDCRISNVCSIAK